MSQELDSVRNIYALDLMGMHLRFHPVNQKLWRITGAQCKAPRIHVLGDSGALISSQSGHLD